MEIHESCRNFVLACELYIAKFPEMTENQHIATIIQRLTKKAQEWAVAVRNTVQQFQEVFDHPDQGESSNA